MGGEFGSSEQSNYFTGFQYQPKFSPIVMNGVLYYDATPNWSQAGAYQGWVAVNLRTGATIWTKNYQNYFEPGSYDLLMCGQIYVYKTMNSYGGETFLWATRTSASGINYLDMFDAATGNYISSINGSQPSGSFGAANVEGSDGSLLQYYIATDPTGAQTFNLWNSSVCLNPTNSQFWGPQPNAVIPYSQGVVWSTPLSESYKGTPFPAGVSWIFDGVAHGCIDTQNNIAIISAGAGNYGLYEWNTGWIVEAAYNLNNGQQIWIKNQTETPYATTMIQPGASNNVYVEWTKETMTFTGYSTLTGNYVWGPTTPDVNPLAYYDQTPTVMAYGCLYTWTFGGYVYCYNMTNGKLIWTWNDGSAGENTPYGVNPLWIIGDYEGSVADHVIYVETGHDYGPPLFNGAQLYAINATDGKEIWSILNFDSGSCPAVVDGYLLAFNAYDNQIYAYGMGPTKTTVSAPSVGVTTATPITISGTVMDISAGSQQEAVAANFPNGLPCVSDASMTQFMEAIYEQSPMPTNITGVPVQIAVLDSNGNHYPIGTVTTDQSGTFSLTWTPNIPGNFTVYATFASTQSYYGSYAEAHFYAGSPPPTPAPTASPPSGLASTGTVELGVAAVIIVIIIIGVVIILTLRRRP
jgi:outer membrane protein assembly factor BamB